MWSKTTEFAHEVTDLARAGVFQFTKKRQLIEKYNNLDEGRIEIILDKSSLFFSKKNDFCDLEIVSIVDSTFFGWLIFKQRDSKPFSLDLKKMEIIVSDYLSK